MLTEHAFPLYNLNTEHVFFLVKGLILMFEGLTKKDVIQSVFSATTTLIISYFFAALILGIR